jgi:hypothetical protein
LVLRGNAFIRVRKRTSAMRWMSFMVLRREWLAE